MPDTLLQVDELATHLRTPQGLVRAVDGVSFTLARGRTLAIVGESGSGKSVLARTLLQLLATDGSVATTGRVAFDGRDLLALSEPAMRALRGGEIAIVFQDPGASLNPVMRIGAQIVEVLTRHLGLRGRAATARAVELLAAVGLPRPAEHADQYPHQLSGGMRQRVAVAVAIAGEPSLLIADEPTTALDPTVQAQVLALLDRLRRAHGMAMILISHDLATVAAHADEVAVMYAGRFVEQAPPRQLFAHARMPYTAALMRAAPRLDDPPHRPLNPIGGHPPDLIAPPAGCRFHPRCERAADTCRVTPPAWSRDATGTHRWACWHPIDSSPGRS